MLINFHEMWWNFMRKCRTVGLITILNSSDQKAYAGTTTVCSVIIFLQLQQNLEIAMALKNSTHPSFTVHRTITIGYFQFVSNHFLEHQVSYFFIRIKFTTVLRAVYIKSCIFPLLSCGQPRALYIRLQDRSKL